MSLCIGIKSDMGIAFGGDSIVSQTVKVLSADKCFLEKVIGSAVVDILSKGSENAASVTASTIDAAVKAAAEKCAADGVKTTVKTFRSRKLHPVYRRGDRYFGGVACVGDYDMSLFLARLAEKIDAGEYGFFEHIGNLMCNLDAVYQVDVTYRHAQFLFAGYCCKAERYEMYLVSVEVNPERESYNRCAITQRNLSEQLFVPIGDTGAVDRLILGRAPGLEELLKTEVHRHFLPVISALVPGRKLGEITIPEAEKYLAEIGADLPEVAGLLDMMEKDGQYNRLTNEINLAALIVVARHALSQMLASAWPTGVSIDHLQRMSLRECLSVIDWLIHSTAQFQEFIARSIPSVGGDIYLATVTAREGFVYRTLNDNF